MRSLDTLINEFKLYVILQEPVPLDLMVRLEEAGIIIAELEDEILSES